MIGDTRVNSEVRDVVDRAGRLTPAEVAALRDAVGWRWFPLTVPPGSSVAGAWAAAVAAARRSGRSDQLSAARDGAREAAQTSPGYVAAAGRGRRMEAGLAVLGLGVVAAVALWVIGQPFFWMGIIVALVGAALVVYAETGRAAAARALQAVEAAAAAAALMDLLEPETIEALRGPWRAALHD